MTTQLSKSTPVPVIPDGPLSLRVLREQHATALGQYKRNANNAIRLNLETLADILRVNQKTVVSLEHNFGALFLSPNLSGDFAQHVPVSAYSDYEAYIDRIVAGEPNVLTADAIVMMARTAGTTGKPKRIPRTKRSIDQVINAIYAQQAVLYEGIGDRSDVGRYITLMSMYVPPLQPSERVKTGSVVHAGYAKIRDQIPLLYTSPACVFEVADQASSLYLHALFGLLERDASYIGTVFMPKILNWMGLIERRLETLLEDLRTGSLSAELKLSDEQRAEIVQHLRADPARSSEVAAAIADPSAGVLHRLWPRLLGIEGSGSGSLSVCLPRLRFLAGPNLPIISTIYSSSEGIVGINLSRDGSMNYTLAAGAAYFEFIPVEEIDAKSPQTVTLGELQVGGEYELAMTTHSGLYRYRLGDVVRITGFYGQAPTLSFLYRRGTILNLVGEKTTESHTQDAVLAAVSSWLGKSDAVREYSVSGGFVGDFARYTFYIELGDGLDHVASTAPNPTEFLDEALGQANPFYEFCRDAERLLAPDVVMVQPGTFDRLGELRSRRLGRGAVPQVKTPRLVNDPDYQALLDRYAQVRWSAGSTPAITEQEVP